MSETSAPRGLQWFGPLAAWLLILCGVAAVTWLGTASPSERQSMAALALAAAMLLTLAFGLVGVGRNPALLRLVAGAAFLFLALMFLLSFADLLTRLSELTGTFRSSSAEHRLPSMNCLSAEAPDTDE